MNRKMVLVSFLTCLIINSLTSWTAEAHEKIGRRFVGGSLVGTYSYTTNAADEFFEAASLGLVQNDSYPNHNLGLGADAQLSLAFGEHMAFRLTGGYVYRAYRSNEDNTDATHSLSFNLLFDRYFESHEKWQPFVTAGVGVSSIDGGLVLGGGTHYDLSDHVSLMGEIRTTILPTLSYAIEPVLGIAYRF